MVQKNAVYRKSAAGLEALARRDAALTPRLRSVLILLDGKRTLEEAAKLSGSPEDMDAIVTRLQEVGMIEVAAEAAPAAVPAAPPAKAAAPAVAPPSPISASAPPKALTLPEAQRAAVRRLTDLLGPTAEDLCMRIEAARTPQEFQALLKRAEGIVRNVGGPAMATSFLQAVEGYRAA